jgi:hypothetical protein
MVDFNRIQSLLHRAVVKESAEPRREYLRLDWLVTFTPIAADEYVMEINRTSPFDWTAPIEIEETSLPDQPKSNGRLYYGVKFSGYLKYQAEQPAEVQGHEFTLMKGTNMITTNTTTGHLRKSATFGVKMDLNPPSPKAGVDYETQLAGELRRGLVLLHLEP